MNPKVFISHASEDKERFVIPFSTKLRANGVDAWVDRWEMLPGDSLVDKIFEEGLKQATAVIVVLSKNSINKKWVKEELNAAFIQKVNHSSKLIPIILDDCEVPVVLKSTVWESIADTNNYDAAFDRILLSIFGKYDKPPLGTLPKYVSLSIDSLPGLTQVDTLVFKVVCEYAIAQSIISMNIAPLLPLVQENDISDELLQESLQILGNRGLISVSQAANGLIPFFSIPWFGFEEYLRVYYPNFKELVDRVAFLIVNESIKDTEALCAKTNSPLIVIDTILDSMDSKGLIKLTRSVQGIYFILDVSVELKRMLRSGTITL